MLGFVIGALRPEPNGKREAPSKVRVEGLQETILRRAGSFFYRTVVGFLVGVLAASVVDLVGIGLACVVYGDLDKTIKAASRDRIAWFSTTVFLTASTASWVGALVGAWLCPGGGRPTAVRGSIFGTSLGLVTGAFAATVLKPDALIASLEAGALVGVFGAVLAWPLQAGRQLPDRD
jgi:hypothetical protein